MAYFSNELPRSDDYGKGEWDDKYAQLAQTIQQKLDSADKPQPSTDRLGTADEAIRAQIRERQ